MRTTLNIDDQVLKKAVALTGITEKTLLLPQRLEANHMEVLSFIENNHLYSKGVGITDIQILSSTIISNYKIWTNDKRLKSISAQFSCLSLVVNV